MLQNPHQQLPESGAAACSGMLLPLVLASRGPLGGEKSTYRVDVVEPSKKWMKIGETG